MYEALPYFQVAEIAVVSTTNGHEIVVCVGSKIVSKSPPFSDVTQAKEAAAELATAIFAKRS